jgi:hypothetical protein
VVDHRGNRSIRAGECVDMSIFQGCGDSSRGSGMTDPTDKIIAPEDWEPAQVICRAPLDALYSQPTCCGCQKCQKERDHGQATSPKPPESKLPRP